MRIVTCKTYRSTILALSTIKWLADMGTIIGRVRVKMTRAINWSPWAALLPGMQVTKGGRERQILVRSSVGWRHRPSASLSSNRPSETASIQHWGRLRTRRHRLWWMIICTIPIRIKSPCTPTYNMAADYNLNHAQATASPLRYIHLWMLAILGVFRWIELLRRSQRRLRQLFRKEWQGSVVEKT